MQASIGVIGGSGLYEMEDLGQLEEVRLSTPFGEPSDSYFVGTHRGPPLAFLRAPRPGAPADADGGQLPGEHLRDEAARRRTDPLGQRRREPARGDRAARHRAPRPVHRPHAPPPRHLLRRRARRARLARRAGLRRAARRSREAARAAGGRLHVGGTYLCIEGPQFSTKAESLLYRSWGVDVIGMTNPHRGAARPRGGALLRDRRPRHRLRLLARGGGGRHRRRGRGGAPANAAARRLVRDPSRRSPAAPELRRAGRRCATRSSPIRLRSTRRRRRGCAPGQAAPGSAGNEASSSLASVAFDTVETPFGRGERGARAGRPSYFSVAASYFAESGSWRRSARTSARSTSASAGPQRRPARARGGRRQDLPLAGGVRLRPERRAAPSTRSSTSSRPSGPRSPPATRLEVRLPGEHRPGAAARGALAGAQPRPRRLRHHELLDRGASPTP